MKPEVLAGFFLLGVGGIFLLYVWRKMNLDLTLHMHTPRYVSLLLVAAVIIWIGLWLATGAFYSLKESP